MSDVDKLIAKLEKASAPHPDRRFKKNPGRMTGSKQKGLRGFQLPIARVGAVIHSPITGHQYRITSTTPTHVELEHTSGVKSKEPRKELKVWYRRGPATGKPGSADLLPYTPAPLPAHWLQKPVKKEGNTMGAVDDLIEKARKINPATDRRFKNNKGARGATNPNAAPKQLGGAMFDRIKAIAQRQSNDEHNSFVARRAAHVAAVVSTNPKKRGLLKPVMAPDRRNLRGYGGKNPKPKAGISAVGKKPLSPAQVNAKRTPWNPATGENHPMMNAMRNKKYNSPPTQYTRQGNPIPNGPNKLPKRQSTTLAHKP